jgi:hypothetical protein
LVTDADRAVALSEQAKGKRVLLRVWRAGASRYIVVEK